MLSSVYPVVPANYPSPTPNALLMLEYFFLAVFAAVIASAALSGGTKSRRQRPISLSHQVGDLGFDLVLSHVTD
jgi:hypothetical protein